MTELAYSKDITLTGYVIRHIATGELMPQLKARKGYSWWNPAGKHKLENKTTGLPRIFPTERIAKQAVNAWFGIPNASYTGYTTPSGEYDYDVRIREDGRKKKDLEIIPVTLLIGEGRGPLRSKK